MRPEQQEEAAELRARLRNVYWPVASRRCSDCEPGCLTCHSLRAGRGRGQAYASQKTYAWRNAWRAFPAPLRGLGPFLRLRDLLTCRDRDEDAVLLTGLPIGSPQEALDTACTVYLTGLGHEPAP